VFIILLAAAAAVLSGVVATALGHGGEMAVFAGDAEPIDLGTVTGSDVAMFRPPMALWGYNMQATDDALDVIATSVSARDKEIAELMQATEDALETIGRLVSARDSEIADLRHRLSGMADDPAGLRAASPALTGRVVPADTAASAPVGTAVQAGRDAAIPAPGDRAARRLGAGAAPEPEDSAAGDRGE
jgi:hypothetical protein